MNHTYQTIDGNTIYKGMPPFTKKFNPFSEDLPLYCSLLFQIATIPMSKIIYGKEIKNGELIGQHFRQYEFQLFGSSSDGYGIMHLFIKDESHFFNNQQSFKYLHGGIWQKIPLTYETMSKMTERELSIIWMDFD